MAHTLFASFFSFLLVLIFSVTVHADLPLFNNDLEYKNATYGAYPRQRYLSNPNVVGPVANIITSPNSALSPSKYVLWAPGGKDLPSAHPMILEAQTGAIVWSGPTYEWEAIGPTVQSCNGSDYITWWSGSGLIDGRKAGMFYIYNTQYEMVWNVSSQGIPKYADAHEIFLTPQCTAIISTYESRPYDLTHWNITTGYLMDSYFQEIDLATGEMLFQWRASDFVNVTDSVWDPTIDESGESIHNGYDFFHVNSVEKDHHGNYLLSARHMHSLYYVSGVNGQVIWTLGGKRNDFKDLSEGNATNFAYQHHARWVDANLTKISFFDDGNWAFKTLTHNVTRGVLVEIDTVARTARLEQSYIATENILSVREGSMQVLQDSPEPGNVVLGYGNEPAWTEFSSNGTVLFDISLGPVGHNRRSADNYRALKVNWTGIPTWNPRIASGPSSQYDFNKNRSLFEVRRQDEEGNYLENNTAYFSWNGATEISHWILLASNDSTKLNVSSHYYATVSKTGFETSFVVGDATKYVQALAVDAQGAVIGATSVVEMQNNVLITGWNYPSLDLAANTEQLKTMQAKSQTVVNSLKDKWEQVKDNLDQVTEKATHKSPVVAIVVGALCTASLLSICIVPVVLRLRRRQRNAYTAFNGPDFVDSELDDMEKLRPSVNLSHPDDYEDFEQARGYFDEPNEEMGEGEHSILSDAEGTLCGSQHGKDMDKL